MPIRIQRKRTKGWKKPEGVVNCTRPGVFGNPFRIGGHSDVLNAKLAVEAYEHWLDNSIEGRVTKVLIKRMLPGMDLMCFCPLDKPCHVDTILRIANS